MLGLRRVSGLLAAASAMLLPAASLSTRRIVVHQALLVEERGRRCTEKRPAVLAANDLSAIFKADAKRERKAAARRARGH
jgi:hypothetical protein